MKYIDLHVHSTMSDGTLSPNEVAEHAASSGLSAIALTDHDTVAGIKEAMEAAANLSKSGHPLRIIPGVEISASYKEKDVHILGLLIDHENEILIRALAAAQKERDERNMKMIEKLNDAGIPITAHDLCPEKTPGAITRTHFAHYLIEHHYAKDNADAFERYLGYHTPFYVKRNYMNPEQAISLIRKADGIPVLAHPLLYKLTIKQVEELVAYLKSLGLAGIETIYSANIGFEESIVRQIARRYELLITGGSDFHGRNKPHIAIGTGKGNLKIPYSILESLEKYKSLR